MLVTESGMATDVSELQPKKAEFPMLVTESGMVTEDSELQYLVRLPQYRVRLP